MTEAAAGAELRGLRAAWDGGAYTADPFDEAERAMRTVLTVEVAAGILAAPLGEKIGDLVLVAGGWPAETAAKADAAGPAGSVEWRVALGAHERATLTADGGSAVRDAWCRCAGDDADRWVRYEGWTAQGCEAHGFVCADCRRLLQVG